MTGPVISLSLERAKRDARLAPCPHPLEIYIAGMIAFDAFYRMTFAVVYDALDSLSPRGRP